MTIKDDGVYLIDGTRTAIGAYGGSLALTRPDDMAASIIRALLQRHPESEADVDEVVLGCANQAGEDNRNVARMAALLSGLDQGVPAITLNRLCASGLDAVIYAGAKIKSGLSDLVLAGGVESMSRAPYVMSKGETPFDKGIKLFDTTLGWRFVNPQLAQRYGSDPLGITAENVAQQYRISREDQDNFALASQQKAWRAIENGRLAREITALDVQVDRKTRQSFAQDEFPRQTTLQKLQALKPAFSPEGSVTAGNASGINDGAALLGIGPIAATERLLARSGFTLNDFDVIEINEAFAAQVLATLQSWRIDFDDTRVNPNGGAIALGHPLGMSGARLVLSSALELHTRQLSNALVTMCVGVGQGVSLVIKAL